ncbi:hypothetical protein AVEN_217765-1 [Araneus ventricosus]|uniref:DNA helicase Pif1-like 2B domain-containing protein n=1 Tax=Araneus ventricosus TaxID=182803 RepID=A0A4Y2Q9L7_ARAVE|nr:hypothetical protein AVEN_217765-1 [Araneus ventricosus]
MPPHALMLKKGVIVMLLRNLNPKQGLCNGIRLSIAGLHENFISAKIVSECNPGGVVFLSRIELGPSDVNLPFVLKRRQFPLIPAYAMTINKSQGQTFDQVGIYFDEPSFHIDSSMLHFQCLGNPITSKFTQRHLKYKENC